MYQEDYYNPADPNDFDMFDVDKMFENEKKLDKGFNIIYRKARRRDGKMYRKRIEVYTSGGTGSSIRDAETGAMLPNLVGSKNEDLFFKVILATGECKSANGSSTLFFCSPQHYANYLECNVEPDIAYNWEKKRDARLTELKRTANDYINVN